MSEGIYLKLAARWDSPVVPAGLESERVLLLEIAAPTPVGRHVERAPVNLGLVIDRSGSMGGGRLAAAKEAARGIASALTDRDRLTVVAFDDAVEVLLDGVAMNRAGRARAEQQIASIDAGGTTDLAGGWFEAARSLAGVLEVTGAAEAHLLVLSDGMANRGIVEPEILQQHAAELAQRGIRTSAVGIGAGYSPLQLDALVEGGQGRLHDAETGDDIIDVVLGELGELQALVARDVQVTLRAPAKAQLEVLSQTRVVRHEGATVQFSLGGLVGGSVRPIALRVLLPAQEAGSTLPFALTSSWLGGADGADRHRSADTSVLRVVPQHDADAQPRDLEVLARVAEIWEATLGYQAMRHNELHQYHEASLVYDSQAVAYCAAMSALPDGEQRRERFERARRRVAQVWDGRSKRHAYALSRKVTRGEKDLRRGDAGDWFDQL